MADEIEFTRREFVAEVTTSLVKVAAIAPCLLAVARCAKTGASNSVSTDSNNLLTLSFSDFPNLQQVNGSYVVNAVLANGQSRPVAVTRTSTSVASAVSAVCTHEGCTINAYSTTTGNYSCPCHGSAFSLTGAVVSGPAASPLTEYSAALESNSVLVSILV